VQNFNRPGAFSGDHPVAMQLFLDLPEDGQTREAYNVGGAWAMAGRLSDVGTWAQNFSSSGARANAIAGAVAGAWQQDASQVQPFLDSASPADRDAGLRGLAQRMVWQDPSGAAGRALEISDASLRHDIVSQVLGEWRDQNPLEMRAWVQGAAGLPDAWKQELLASGP
jgi:hypothetical protein